MSDKKNKQLGMKHGTAASKLKKMVLFDLIKQLNKDVCYRCGKKIEEISELSLDHMTPWENSENPVQLFFDVNNIAFSHLRCNVLNTSYRTSPVVNLECFNCHKIFERLEREHRQRIKRGTKKFFCSKSCRSQYFHKT